MAIIHNSRNRLAREIVKGNMDERKRLRKVEKDKEKNKARLERKKSVNQQASAAVNNSPAMESYPVKIKSIDRVTHDVLKIVTGKPVGYKFIPGQATEIAINKDGWREEKRPFTFTSLPVNSYLEFTIKTYPARKGVTNELLNLKKNDELILHDVFGAISYKDEGVFIAGGAGVTPFISIFRHLHANGNIGNNLLVFANKTKADIILEQEFKNWLGDAFINILADEEIAGYHHGMINEDFLKANIAGFDKQFYVCGPPPMMDAVQKQLKNLGVAENLITVEI